VATQRITESSRLLIVDTIVSGVHEPATSHFQLLGAFADRRTLEQADAAMSARGYRTHEVRGLRLARSKTGHAV